MSTESILVTGASGFIGREIVTRLSKDKRFTVIAAVRRPPNNSLKNVTYIEVTDATPDMSWQELMVGVDIVVHSIARVHVMSDNAANPAAEYMRVNVDISTNLARQAADAGVRRFIFLSSIKVNGEETQLGKPFRADDQPAPVCAYGKSKLQAEVELRNIAETTGMDVVIIRPPLVYGPGVKANFESMMRWVCNGWPLPIGNISNKRSLVALDNLVDLVGLCCLHEDAANRVFLVSDDDDVSTVELIRRIGDAMQRPARLLFVPVALLRLFGVIVRRKAEIDRLLSSLQVDIEDTRSTLDWAPVTTMDDALSETARCFRDSDR